MRNSFSEFNLNYLGGEMKWKAFVEAEAAEWVGGIKNIGNTISRMIFSKLVYKVVATIPLARMYHNNNVCSSQATLFCFSSFPKIQAGTWCPKSLKNCNSKDSQDISDRAIFLNLYAHHQIMNHDPGAWIMVSYRHHNHHLPQHGAQVM